MAKAQRSASQASRVPIPAGPLLDNLQLSPARILHDLHLCLSHARKDQILVQPGDLRAPLIALTKGTALKYWTLPDGTRQILGVFIPGDIIGLDVLLAGAPAFPVLAAGAVSYATIERDHATRLARQDSGFRDQALAALARERASAEWALIRLGHFNAEQRVASELISLYRRLAERSLACRHEFKFELTRRHLADLLGLTPVHLGRAINRLKARGVLSIVGQRVTILNPDALAAAAILPTVPLGWRTRHQTIAGRRAP